MRELKPPYQWGADIAPREIKKGDYLVFPGDPRYGRFEGQVCSVGRAKVYLRVNYTDHAVLTISHRLDELPIQNAIENADHTLVVRETTVHPVVQPEPAYDIA